MSFKEWLVNEQKQKFVEVSGKFEYDDFEELMGSKWDEIGFSGDVWIIPQKVQKSFDAAVKKLKLKVKEVK